MEKETPTEQATEDEIPDDFFEDFENNEFLDELVENVAAVANEDDGEVNDEEKSEREDDGSSQFRGRSSSPIVERCLKEIDKLTQDIRRRKRRLQQELSSRDTPNRDSETEAPTSSTDIDRSKSDSRRHSRRSSRSPPRRTRDSHNSDTYKSRATTGRHAIPRTSRRRTPSPVRSRPIVRRSRSRERRNKRHSKSRERRRSVSPPHKRLRRSGSPPPAKSQISFLEELERTFAKQGKDFPEKDLLLRSQQIPEPQPSPIYHHHHHSVSTQSFYDDQMHYQHPSDLIASATAAIRIPDVGPYGTPYGFSQPLLLTPDISMHRVHPILNPAAHPVVNLVSPPIARSTELYDACKKATHNIPVPATPAAESEVI